MSARSLASRTLLKVEPGPPDTLASPPQGEFMPYRPQPLELLLLVAGIVSLVLLAGALDMSPPLALGGLSGILYLSLLARRVLRLASLPMKRRATARNLEPA